jgi:hypothetical protein
VFCAKFWAKRGHWEKCEGTWCGACFLAEGENTFPIHIPIDDGGKLCSLMQKTSADLNMQGMESVFLLGFSVGSAISGTSKAEI